MIAAHGHVMVCCSSAGAVDDPRDIAVARQQTHDALIKGNPVRLGPVRWYVFPRTASAEVIARVAHVPTDYDDLAAWLDAQDDAVLVFDESSGRWRRVDAACRVCGCTEDRACAGGCMWVPDPELLGDLCSACLPGVVEARA